MNPIRIFISSPGDVTEEREKARLVVEALRRHYGSTAELHVLMWEDLALDIDLSAQQTIERELVPEEKVPDIAVFILWSRLGSELSEEKTPRPGGGSYHSGTEHEFELMLEARERCGGGKPHILAYWRQDEEGFVEVLRREGPGRYDELLRQKQLAGRFVEERFMDEKGRNVRGLVLYREPLSFAERLHRHLRQKIDEILGTEGDPAERWRENPYRGLDVFETSHAAIFHGREEETQDLVERLRDQEERRTKRLRGDGRAQAARGKSPSPEPVSPPSCSSTASTKRSTSGATPSSFPPSTAAICSPGSPASSPRPCPSCAAVASALRTSPSLLPNPPTTP